MSSRSVVWTLLIALSLACPGCASKQQAPAGYTRTAPLFDNMGDLRHPVSTDVPLAQRYFDQGLTLSFAFNHAEAERSFREAAKLDPNCAMAWWGVALVLGPNINAPMSDDAVPKAWDALQKAQALSPYATARERAYIDALSKRYAPELVEDRTQLDRAYAIAMCRLAERYPDDLDAAALCAESLMDTMPWDYWLEDGQPKPETKKVLAELEKVIGRDPNHAGANHLYIHAVEAVYPERGVEAADRLGGLVPGAGHLVHMPSHIYIRVGRYHDGSLANERAIAADDDYVVQCHAQGLYPLAYMAHNHHFLWATATFEGRSQRALDSAHHIAGHTDPQIMRQPEYATLQHFWVTPLFAMVRFGKWDDILAAAEPDQDLLYPRGVWHYARAMALMRTGDLDAAAYELERIDPIIADPALDSITIFDINTGREVLQIGSKVASAELAAARGDHDRAIADLREAIELEHSLLYDEPPTWHQPVRQTLGAVLLEAARPAEAEVVYREDLATYPDNGWSLFGLARSLRAQGRADEAAAVEQQFEQAWTHADITLDGSRF